MTAVKSDCLLPAKARHARHVRQTLHIEQQLASAQLQRKKGYRLGYILFTFLHQNVLTALLIPLPVLAADEKAPGQDLECKCLARDPVFALSRNGSKSDSSDNGVDEQTSLVEMIPYLTENHCQHGVFMQS